MKIFKPGYRLKIIEHPQMQYIGILGTVLPISGFGYENDDVFVNLDDDNRYYLKEHQLEKLPPTQI